MYKVLFSDTGTNNVPNSDGGGGRNMSTLHGLLPKVALSKVRRPSCFAGCTSMQPRPLRVWSLNLIPRLSEFRDLYIQNPCNNSFSGSHVACCKTKCVSLANIYTCTLHIFPIFTRAAFFTGSTYCISCLFVPVLNMLPLF